jgi:Fe-S cluster biosynthesis and repair protein YggX
MSRMVMCQKLGRELPGLTFPPMKGELGQRIFDHISDEAWKLWLKHSTMVINEYRLNPSEPEAQKVLREQLEKFLFSGGAQAPEGYVPPKQ